MTHLSITTPSLLKTEQRVASLSLKKDECFFETSAVELTDVGPLSRITDIPPVPGGVAVAIMVSITTLKIKKLVLTQWAVEALQ